MGHPKRATRIPRGAVFAAIAATNVLASGESLAPAARAVGAGRFDEALASIESALEAGTVHASEVYTDPRLRALREDAGARRRWREIMGRHVGESRIRIAAEGEPGSPMRIEGRVVDVATGKGVAGAVVYLFHTDATGNYAPDGAVGEGANPRLFAFVRTDYEGKFEVRTIEPAAYPGAEESFAHVHYRADREGYERAVDEFHPYTHPASESARAESIRLGHPSNVVHDADGALVCEVTIPLAKAPAAR